MQASKDSPTTDGEKKESKKRSKDSIKFKAVLKEEMRLMKLAKAVDDLVNFSDEKEERSSDSDEKMTTP